MTTEVVLIIIIINMLVSRAKKKRRNRRANVTKQTTITIIRRAKKKTTTTSATPKKKYKQRELQETTTDWLEICVFLVILYIWNILYSHIWFKNNKIQFFYFGSKFGLFWLFFGVLVFHALIQCSFIYCRFKTASFARLFFHPLKRRT